VPAEEGELSAKIVDSNDLVFENSLKISPRPLAGS
jgi:hypothetical protein